MKQTPIIGWLLAVVVVLTSCHKQADQNGAFHQKELTLRDVVYLYHIPIDKDPYAKFQWSFDKPKYTRIVIDRKLPNQTQWEMYRATPFPHAYRNAIFIYRLILNRGIKQQDQWILECQRGGEDETTTTTIDPGDLSIVKTIHTSSHYSSASFALPTMGESTQWGSQVPPVLTPDEILTFGNTSVQYRLRLEQSDTAYPETP